MLNRSVYGMFDIVCCCKTHTHKSLSVIIIISHRWHNSTCTYF